MTDGPESGPEGKKPKKIDPKNLRHSQEDINNLPDIGDTNRDDKRIEDLIVLRKIQDKEAEDRKDEKPDEVLEQELEEATQPTLGDGPSLQEVMDQQASMIAEPEEKPEKKAPKPKKKVVKKSPPKEEPIEAPKQEVKEKETPKPEKPKKVEKASIPEPQEVEEAETVSPQARALPMIKERNKPLLAEFKHEFFERPDGGVVVECEVPSDPAKCTAEHRECLGFYIADEDGNLTPDPDYAKYVVTDSEVLSEEEFNEFV